MTTHKKLNLSRHRLSELSGVNVQNGDSFENCNFCQIVPHTKILSEYSGLTFMNCNLTNCDVPVDSIIENCFRLQVSRCGNIYPMWPDVAECAIDCEHVVDVDTVIIDGEEQLFYYYKDKKVT